MVSFSFTFIFTVLAVYTGHRGTESDNKFYYQLSVTYIKYSIMYTLSTIAIIRSGHLVTTQVRFTHLFQQISIDLVRY